MRVLNPPRAHCLLRSGGVIPAPPGIEAKGYRMISIRKLAAGSLLAAAFVAACSISGPSQGGASASASPAGNSPTVMTATAGGQTILVDGSNGMTVYTFASDVAGSGRSACTGNCLVIWPPLTVRAGTTPTAGPGVTGTLGTITTDDGSVQVTYQGLPLYFYDGDKAPGDTNGNYPGWNLVAP
jgi:predicted lipoprotein with Yx(FWY)xxD motif